MQYSELESHRVDTRLSEDRQLHVSLAAKHAAALIALIETTRVVQGWGVTGTPFLARLSPLGKGLFLILRILLLHSRLLALISVIVLNSRTQIWEQHTDGHVMFTFKQ